MEKINVEEKKAAIIAALKQKGPLLPVQAAREIGLSILFSSAILSEMAENKLLKLSNLKVGGSPLYYLEGQESQLENFAKYLGGKEKEAFELLKKHQLLEDATLEPAHRVAMREIKDFAIPMKVRVGSEEQLFWRFYSTNKEEIAQKLLRLTKKIEKKTEKEKIHKAKIKQKQEESAIQKTKQEKAEKHEEKSLLSADFSGRIFEWLQKKNIEFVEKKQERKKEIEAIVNIISQIGKIPFLLIAKEKKNINEADISIALQKGQAARLNVIFLSTGKPTKKAQQAIESFKTQLIFRQLDKLDAI